MAEMVTEEQLKEIHLGLSDSEWGPYSIISMTCRVLDLPLKFRSFYVKAPVHKTEEEYSAGFRSGNPRHNFEEFVSLAEPMINYWLLEYELSAID